MYKNRELFEVYLEILSQIKLGNCHEFTLLKSTNLSEHELHSIIDPLLTEGMLKSVQTDRDKGDQLIYKLTDRGIAFIDYISLGIEYSEPRK